MAKRIKRIGYIDFCDGNKEDIVTYRPSDRIPGAIEIIATNGLYIFVPGFVGFVKDRMYKIVPDLYYSCLDGVQVDGEGYAVDFKEFEIFKGW